MANKKIAALRAKRTAIKAALKPKAKAVKVASAKPDSKPKNNKSKEDEEDEMHPGRVGSVRLTVGSRELLKSREA